MKQSTFIRKPQSKWTTKVLLDSQHIREISRGLDNLKMSRQDLACRLGCRLSQLSKYLCYDRQADGWLMPKHIWVLLKHFLQIN